MIASIEPNCSDSFKTIEVLAVLVEIDFVQYTVESLAKSKLCGFTLKEKEPLGSSVG